MKKKKIGKVIHFFDKINVAVIKLDGNLNVGDEISVEGSTTNLQQKVDSMQIDKSPIPAAKKGQEVGMKVKDKVRVNDLVYKA